LAITINQPHEGRDNNYRVKRAFELGFNPRFEQISKRQNRLPSGSTADCDYAPESLSGKGPVHKTAPPLFAK